MVLNGVYVVSLFIRLWKFVVVVSLFIEFIFIVVLISLIIWLFIILIHALLPFILLTFIATNRTSRLRKTLFITHSALFVAASGNSF